MPYLTAAGFIRHHGGIEGLRKFISMLDRGEDGETIAQEFHISEGRVTQLSKLFGKYQYTACKDVLDLIKDKSEDKIEVAKSDLEFVRQQQAKIIPFREKFDESAGEK